MARMRRWHLVEHRDGARVRSLGRVSDAFPHHSTLCPFLSRLLHEGVGRGELVLVDESTGQEVARRAVHPPRKPPRQ